MKLLNQTRGPVTLTKIDYAPRLSEETFCFSADIAVTLADGTVLKGTVENRGTGGDNNIRPFAVHDAVEAYAKTLPNLPCESFPDGLTMSYDLLISDMVGDAVEAFENARETKKWLKKGYTHRITVGDRCFYSKAAPSEAAMLRQFGAEASTAQVVALTA